MNKIKEIAGLFCLSLLFTVAFCIDARADDVFSTFAGRATTFAKGFQNLAFCMAGFGIIMFTWLAICGKINFKHLGYIIICLFFLSGTGLLITYISGSTSHGLNGYAKPTTFVNGAHDTFQNAVPDEPSSHNSSI